MPRLIAGLGNPGPEYENTRHNAGFRVLDALLARAGGSWRRLKERHEARVRIGGEDVLLLKPMTFMNRSGPPVLDALSRREASPGDCLVVVDDMALPLGVLRLKARGSSGGHHGLDSLIGALGTSDFPRLRLGIGPPPRGGEEGGEGAAHVLGTFGSAERPRVEAALLRAAEVAESWIREGLPKAQSRCHAPPA